jgi:hypothetical protein
VSSPNTSPLPQLDRAWRGVETGTPGALRCAELALAAGDEPLALRTLILTDHVDAAAARLALLREQEPAHPATARLATELAFRTGALAEAEREARAALAAERRVTPGVTDHASQGGGAERLLATVLVARGAYAEASAVCATAELHLALNEPRRAVQLARRDGWRRTAAGQTNPARSRWRATLAAALFRADHKREAIAVADDGLTRARAFGAPTALATALLARALADPDPETRAEYAAAAVAVPTPAVLIHAEAQIELGATLIRLGCSAEARDPLGHALETAEDAGAEPLAERAARTLARSALRVVA